MRGVNNVEKGRIVGGNHDRILRMMIINHDQEITIIKSEFLFLTRQKSV